MGQNTTKWVYVILALITLFGLQLRLKTISYAEVDTPVRADAKGYLVYAINMKAFNVYSRSEDAIQGKVAKPIPDAFRPPGYPLFLRLFIGDSVTDKMLYTIELIQALLSTLVILLAYASFAGFLGPPLALVAALLTAISPHLVFTNVFILSESLFCFLLMLALWTLSQWKPNSSPWLLLGTGALLAFASLTRPWTQYFFVLLIPLMLLHFPLARVRWSALALAVGMALPVLCWIGRNLLTLGIVSDNGMMLSAFYQGHYPGLMYDNRPETFAYSYRFDPRVAEISASFGAVWAEMRHYFQKDPVEYIAWYFVGKPFLLLNWDLFEGSGDVFIYPIIRTPYTEFTLFKVTHAFMRYLHEDLVLLAILGSLAAWLPRSWVGMSDSQRFMARSLSALFVYFVLVHCILKPEARYSIPMRPVIYGMAMFALWYGAGLLRRVWPVVAVRLAAPDGK